MKTFPKDGRKSLLELYRRYDKLKQAGWTRELICLMDKKLPIYAYLSPKTRSINPKPAFWILAGIHGEEPAGPNALAENVDKLIQYSLNGMPIVLAPLLNPLGYCRDNRYFDLHRDGEPGHSVTDSEHMLPDLEDPTKNRQAKPSNIYAKAVLKWTDKTVKSYPPRIVVDHHEDEVDRSGVQFVDSGSTYSYACGNEKVVAPLCKVITAILKKNNFPIQESGVTRFGEKIINGFVLNTHDGSIDEFLALRGALAAFVIETTRDDEKNIPLKQRVAVHTEIIRLYPEMWELLN